MNRFNREVSRRNMAKRKRKAYALYGKYTKDDDLKIGRMSLMCASPVLALLMFLGLMKFRWFMEWVGK